MTGPIIEQARGCRGVLIACLVGVLMWVGLLALIVLWVKL